jgi:hypothetical protein
MMHEKKRKEKDNRTKAEPIPVRKSKRTKE